MSLGKELASIRKSKNLTLEDIQNAVKIPLDTLKSIENDSIFSDPTRNMTYVRSFVRSYAKYLKIDDDVIVKALDEIYEGTYSGTLYESSDDTKTEKNEINDELSDDKTTFSENASNNEIKAEKPISKPVKPEPVPDEEETINWADLGRQFTTASKSSRMWVVIIVVAAGVVIAGTGFFFWDDINGYINSFSDQTELETMENPVNQETLIPAPADSAYEDMPETQNEENQSTQNVAREESQQDSEPIDLGDRLTVAVYAAYGQLEPVRITSDLNWRTNPFWMEQGEAYNFDFRDTLLVRGQYSRMLLLFNGNVIENPRQNYFDPSFNSIMITRSIINQERYLTPPSEFPLEVGPPDSIIYRINY